MWLLWARVRGGWDSKAEGRWPARRTDNFKRAFSAASSAYRFIAASGRMGRVLVSGAWREVLGGYIKRRHSGERHTRTWAGAGDRSGPSDPSHTSIAAMNSFRIITTSCLLFLVLQLPGPGGANPLHPAMPKADLMDFKVGPKVNGWVGGWLRARSRVGRLWCQPVSPVFLS